MPGQKALKPLKASNYFKLLSQVYNAKRFNVDMSQFPTITRLEASLSKLPAFAAAHPSMQQDCPEELK